MNTDAATNATILEDAVDRLTYDEARSLYAALLPLLVRAVDGATFDLALAEAQAVSTP